MKSEVTVEYLMAVHKFAIESTREDELWLSDLVRSDADLYFISERISATADIYERSAIGLYGIACNHPFYEGNKRTALLLCENLLDDEIFIVANEEDVFSFVMKVACGNAKWMKSQNG
jgi:death-on-curing protein